MTRDQMIQEAGKWIFNPILFLWGVFFLLVLASPFVWIWFDFATAIKMFVSGLLGLAILVPINKFVKKIVSRVVDDAIAKQSEQKVSFKQKLEEYAKSRKH